MPAPNQVTHLWAERAHPDQTYCGQRITDKRTVAGSQPCYYCDLAATNKQGLTRGDFWELARHVQGGWMPEYKWLLALTYEQAVFRLNGALAGSLLREIETQKGVSNA